MRVSFAGTRSDAARATHSSVWLSTSMVRPSAGPQVICPVKCSRRPFAILRAVCSRAGIVIPPSAMSIMRSLLSILGCAPGFIAQGTFLPSDYREHWSRFILPKKFFSLFSTETHIHALIRVLVRWFEGSNLPSRHIFTRIDERVLEVNFTAHHALQRLRNQL